MKNVLVFCPKFMGYEKKIKNALSQKYKVTIIDTEANLKPIRDDYNDLPVFYKAFYKINKSGREKVRQSMLDQRRDYFNILIEKEDNNYYDYILVINGDGIPNSVYSKLKQKYGDAIWILYLWDDLQNLFVNTQLKYFDKIFSYNIDDSRENGFRYIPMFSEQDEFMPKVNKEYDIAIVATINSKREKIVREIYNKYKDIYKFYIYFYDPKNKFDFFSNSSPLKYEQYTDVLARSRAVLDIGRMKQTGPTTRVFDSIVTYTKVISFNKNLRKYPINTDNLLIIDDKLQIPKEFIFSDYNEKIVQMPLCVNCWLKRLGLLEG